MNTQPFISGRAVREFDAFGARWMLIVAGLVLLCFLSGCTKSRVAAVGASLSSDVSVVALEKQ